MRVTSTRDVRGGWRFLRTLGCVATLTISLSGCLTVPTASDTLLAQLNAAEKQLLIKHANPGPSGFNPDDAALYATLDTYAPATGRFHAALTILKDYAALIKSLVEGQAATAQANAIKTTVDNISTLGAVAPQIAAQVTAIDAVVGAFTPVVAKALTIRTQAQARDLVAQGAKPVRETITALRNATPAMFVLLMAAGNAQSSGSAPDRGKARVALSNYVVLLDRLQETFDKLNDAFQHRSNSISAVALAQSTGELAADVKIVQQAFASLK